MAEDEKKRPERGDYQLLRVEFDALRRRTAELEASMVEVRKRQDALDDQLNRFSNEIADHD